MPDIDAMLAAAKAAKPGDPLPAPEDRAYPDPMPGVPATLADGRAWILPDPVVFPLVINGADGQGPYTVAGLALTGRDASPASRDLYIAQSIALTAAFWSGDERAALGHLLARNYCLGLAETEALVSGMCGVDGHFDRHRARLDAWQDVLNSESMRN